MVFYFEIIENSYFLEESKKTNFVAFFNFILCLYFWLAKILPPSIRNCLFLGI
jgi:hypothetical protein